MSQATEECHSVLAELGHQGGVVDIVQVHDLLEHLLRPAHAAVNGQVKHCIVHTRAQAITIDGVPVELLVNLRHVVIGDVEQVLDGGSGFDGAAVGPKGHTFVGVPSRISGVVDVSTLVFQYLP